MFGLAATNYHSEFFAKNFQKKRFSGKYGEILTQNKNMRQFGVAHEI